MTLVKHNRRNWNDNFFMPGLFGQMWDEMLSDSRLSTNSFNPRTDINEDESGFSIEVTLPGMKRDEVKIELNKDLLTIEGERKIEKEENKKTWHRVESSYGSFKRSFRLPDNINRDQVEAKFEDGILRIFLPKSEKLVPKSIEIK